MQSARYFTRCGGSRITWKLYKNEKAYIRYGPSEEVATVRKGVRQGRNLSPDLFSAYIEDGLENINEETGEGKIICSGLLTTSQC